jgi:uridine kinase
MTGAINGSPDGQHPVPPRPVVVAIAGGSGTGKSTLAAALSSALESLRPVVLVQDHYFRDFAEYDPAERELVRTANHPDAVNWPEFHAALDRLAAGESVELPAPGTRRRARGDPVRTLGPAGLVIVEGLFALWDERCRARAQLRLYTEVADDERVLRRVYRDVTERGGTVEGVVSWYRRDVRPNFERFTAASREYADLVVPTERHNQNMIDALSDAIRAMARRHQSAAETIATSSPTDLI